jgi:hypothetical protein
VILAGVGRIHLRARCLPLRTARLFLRPNELRRSSDRLEAALLAGLATAFAAAVVLAALLAAHVYRSEKAAPPTDLRPATAVLASPATITAGVFPHEATARATWRLSAGTERSGLLTSDLAPGLYGKPAGASVPVWLDRAGAPEPPPQGQGAPAVNAALIGLVVTAGAAALLACGYRLCLNGLDRHRLAGWSSAWAVTGPRWTSRQ